MSSELQVVSSARGYLTYWAYFLIGLLSYWATCLPGDVGQFDVDEYPDSEELAEPLPADTDAEVVQLD